MFAAPLKLSPVLRETPVFGRLRWKRLPEDQSRNVEVDAGTLRVAGLNPIPLRRVIAVAHHPKGIGAGLEICLEAESEAELSRVQIPARAFADFKDAGRIAYLIEEAIAARGGRDERDLEEIRSLCRERSVRIPWLSFWFGAVSLALMIASHLTVGGDPVLTSIAHGAAVPDMIRAGEYHRLLTASFVHARWLHAVPMILGWFLMIAVEKRAGTALMAGGFVGGGVAGYLSIVGPGGAWQAFGASTGFVGMVGAIAATMTVDPERLDALAVRPEAAQPIRAAGILLLIFAFTATSIETHFFWPVHFCALFGGTIAGLLLSVASRAGGVIDKIARNAFIALCMGAIGWTLASVARDPEIELVRYLETTSSTEFVDAYALAGVIERIGRWDGASEELRSRAEQSKAEALSRIESDRARESLNSVSSRPSNAVEVPKRP